MENQIEKLGVELDKWVSTIIQAIESGEKVMVHKSNDYTLKPKFYPEEMKFECIRHSDDSNGKIYLNIYEIEELYKSVKKKVFKIKNNTFPKQKQKKERKMEENTVTTQAPEGKKMACSKFIISIANEIKSMSGILAKANEAGYDIKLGYVKNINKKYNLGLEE